VYIKHAGVSTAYRMGATPTKIDYVVACEVQNTQDDNEPVPCDIDIRVHCHNGALPTILHYGMKSCQVYTHTVHHIDLGTAEYVECAVRRGAPAARGASVKSAAPPFVIRQVRVTETRETHTCSSLFHRLAPLQLGDSLGVSVLLQPVGRSSESQLLHRSMALPAIAEEGAQLTAEQHTALATLSASEEVV
jgi:hypothetical protein